MSSRSAAGGKAKSVKHKNAPSSLPAKSKKVKEKSDKKAQAKTKNITGMSKTGTEDRENEDDYDTLHGDDSA